MKDAYITEKQYQAELTECVKQLKKTETYMRSLEGQLRILTAENAFLVQKNVEYERKLSRIVSNPFYKVGIKLYHAFVKLRQKR